MTDNQTHEDVLAGLVKMLGDILGRLDELEAFRDEMLSQGKGPEPFNQEN